MKLAVSATNPRLNTHATERWCARSADPSEHLNGTVRNRREKSLGVYAGRTKCDPGKPQVANTVTRRDAIMQRKNERPRDESRVHGVCLVSVQPALGGY